MNVVGALSDTNDDDAVVLGVGLAASDMIKSSPLQHGVALKLRVPLFFSVLPTPLQNLVMTWGCLSWLRPTWYQRYLILIGSFLYKFKTQSAATPKGTPLSLEKIESDLLLSPAQQQADDMAVAFSLLPPGYDSIFTVSTFGKKHYYAVASREEALSWVNTLRQQRQETITRSMGHAANMPYPKAWAYFDSLGRSLQKSKQRIKEKVEQHNMREMELADMPRGYYG